MTTHRIDAPAHREAKRLIGQAAPHIKSSHRAEALARGLGFGTNAALQAALDAGPLDAPASRTPFEAFLKERGYCVQELQVSLLTDAVMLACGESLDRVKLGPAHHVTGRVMACVSCLDLFMRQGPHNRICHECMEREGRLFGVNHSTHVISQHLGDMLKRGRHPSIDGLRVRPGWSHIIDGAEFMAMSRQAIRIMKLLDEGAIHRMTNSDRTFVYTHGDHVTCADVPPPRGWPTDERLCLALGQGAHLRTI